MTAGKGRRLGGPATLSTTDDPTPPEAPPPPVTQEPTAELAVVSEASVVEQPAAPWPPAPAASPVPRVEPPRAADIIQPRVKDGPREQLNGMVPAELELIRRMTLFRLDHGLHMRDQMALGMDAWLRAQGY